MTLTIVAIAALAAFFIVATFATVPPRLVPWPAHRNIRTDVSMLRVYLARRISTDRARERDEARETVRQLRESMRGLRAENAKLARRLADAETRIHALQELTLPEALALVAAHRDRAADRESGSDEGQGEAGGAPPPAFGA